MIKIYFLTLILLICSYITSYPQSQIYGYNKFSVPRTQYIHNINLPFYFGGRLFGNRLDYVRTLNDFKPTANNNITIGIEYSCLSSNNFGIKTMSWGKHKNLISLDAGFNFALTQTVNDAHQSECIYKDYLFKIGIGYLIHANIVDDDTGGLHLRAGIMYDILSIKRTDFPAKTIPFGFGYYCNFGYFLIFNRKWIYGFDICYIYTYLNDKNNLILMNGDFTFRIPFGILIPN
jgi:hypothetical protein